MSNHAPDKKITVASYVPDQAGRQIGWISTEAKENVGQFKDVSTVEVNIGVARISEKGAQRG